MYIYNTASRSKEVLTPEPPAELSMYVCGPTVYNHIHIGNARVFVFFDVARRYLRLLGYQVKYVQNFTDFDDRLLAASLRDGVPVLEIAERYIEGYFASMDALGVERATLHPRASEHVEQMIEAVAALLEKGAAYTSQGDVYFRALKHPGYGQLAHQPIEELQVGARVEVGDKKEQPLDFALWKSASREEMGWEAPWGYGRPGWHLECSVMIRSHLGETIDLHAGGEDLCFPHHENERAQSEAWTGQPLVRYWLHNAFVLSQGIKMAKSIGNDTSVQGLLKEHDPLVLRYLLLSAHYRRPLQFSEDALQQATTSVKRLTGSVENLWARCLQGEAPEGDVDPKLHQELAQLEEDFHKAMADDFHAANAISVLFGAVKCCNHWLATPKLTAGSLGALEAWFTRHGGEVLGLLPPPVGLLPTMVQEQIAAREKARRERDFAAADAIRFDLYEKGIVLEDTAQGTRWKRL